MELYCEFRASFFDAAKAPPVQRKPLKQRDYEVDLESRLGKTQVSFVAGLISIKSMFNSNVYWVCF